VHLLRMFFSRWIQPLHQRVTEMWMYTGLSCPDRSFSEELSEVVINTRMHKVLDHETNLNHRADPNPLREGVISTRVSLLSSILVVCMILSCHRAHNLMQGLKGGRSKPRGVNLTKNAVKRAVNHARNEKL
jgi:hypothetical protein